MTPERLKELSRLYRSGLLEDVIPFWIRHGIDKEQGGYFSTLDRDGSLLGSDKAIWVQGRFAWILATLYNSVEKNTEWLHLAKYGLDFLDIHGLDNEDGVMWFRVTREGCPVEKCHYGFSESFACIANAAYYQATQETKYAEKASKLFEDFWKHWQAANMVHSAGENDAAQPVKSLGYPMIAINTAQQCREAGVEGDWDSKIDACIAEIRKDFVHDDIECVLDNVTMKGHRLDDSIGRTLNPGHAIEAAWFILEEARCRNKDAQLLSLGTKMLDWMWTRGWDPEYGGIFYYVDIDGTPLLEEDWHAMKFWWPQNETIIATLMAHLLTGNELYEHMHTRIHNWAYTHFSDSEYGEWYAYLNRDGSVAAPVKGTLWKGPFHLPRMQWKCWQLCQAGLGSILD